MSQREAKVLQTFSAGFEGIMLLEAVFKAKQIPKDFIFFKRLRFIPFLEKRSVVN